MAKTQPTVKQMAAELAQYGRHGDIMLAHINPQEAAVLKAMGGSGSINPDTGLPEYWNPLKDLQEAAGDIYDNTIGVVVGPHSITGQAVEAARNVTGATAGAIQDVASKLGSTVEAVVSDPRKLAAVAIMVAYPGAAAAVGDFLLPEAVSATLGATGTAIVGQTAINTAMNGGDVGMALKTALIQQGMPAATAELSKAMSVSDTSMLGQLFNKYGAQAASSAGLAAIMGKDPMAALAFSGVQAATDVLMDVTGAKEIISKLPPAAQKSVIAMASAKLANRDPSQAVADSLFNSALGAAAKGYSIQTQALSKGLTALTEDQLDAFPDDLNGQNAAFAALRNAQASGTTLSGQDLQNYLANISTPEGYGNVVGRELASSDGSTPGGTQGVTKPNWLQLDAGEITQTSMYPGEEGTQKIDVFRPDPNDPTKSSFYTAVYDPVTGEVRYDTSSKTPDGGMVVKSSKTKPAWNTEEGSQTGSATSTEKTGAETGTSGEQTTDTTVSQETEGITSGTGGGGGETTGPAKQEPIQVDAEGVPIYAESAKAGSVNAPEGYKLLSASEGRNPPPGSYYDPDQDAWFTPGEATVEEGTGATGGGGAAGAGPTGGVTPAGPGTEVGPGTGTTGGVTPAGPGAGTTGGVGPAGPGAEVGPGAGTTGGVGPTGPGTSTTGGTGGTTGGVGPTGPGTGTGTGTGTDTTSNALTNATLLAGIAAGLKSPTTGTGTAGGTGTTGGTGTSAFATTPSAPIENLTYKNAYTDFTPLNPLLFSLAGLGPVTGNQSDTNPLSKSAAARDIALETSLDNEPQQQSNAPMEWFSAGGLAGRHPMGEPQYYSEGALTSLQIKGDGDGTSDDIPAMVAKDEYVLPADIVSSLGNGSSDAGASVLDKFVRQIRTHKQSNDPSELPPDSVGPLEYLSAAISKGQKHGRNI